MGRPFHPSTTFPNSSERTSSGPGEETLRRTGVSAELLMADRPPLVRFWNLLHHAIRPHAPVHESVLAFPVLRNRHRHVASPYIRRIPRSEEHTYQLQSQSN